MAKELFAAKYTAVWIGGFFFWIIKGFKGKLFDHYEKEYESRDVWTGYFITLIFVGVIFYLLAIN